VRLLNAGRDGFIDLALPIFEAAGIDPDMDAGVTAPPVGPGRQRVHRCGKASHLGW
jgi:hypothetical protein